MIASQTLLVANTLTEVYRAATNLRNEVWVEVFICNQDGGQWSTLDVALTDKGRLVPDAHQYLYRGYSLRPNQTKHPRLLLRDGDRILVQVTTNRVSVVVSAEEIVTPRTVERQSDRIDERLDAMQQELQRIAGLIKDDEDVVESAREF